MVLRYKISGPVKRGRLVCHRWGELVPFDGLTMDVFETIQIIGSAARNIRKGEVIEWSPTHDTEDVIHG